MSDDLKRNLVAAMSYSTAAVFVFIASRLGASADGLAFGLAAIAAFRGACAFYNWGFP